MKRKLRSLLADFRALLVSIAQWFKSLPPKLRPQAGDFGSLMMCPSCGRITSRYKSLCLECGKTLKPA